MTKFVFSGQDDINGAEVPGAWGKYVPSTKSISVGCVHVCVSPCVCFNHGMLPSFIAKSHWHRRFCLKQDVTLSESTFARKGNVQTSMRPECKWLWRTQCVLSEVTHWNLNSQCDGIRRSGFGKWLGHESGGFMNGISTFLKETPDRSLTPAMWRHWEKVIYEPESGFSRHEPSSALILDSQPIELWKINVCSNPLSGISFIATWLD